MTNSGVKKEISSIGTLQNDKYSKKTMKKLMGKAINKQVKRNMKKNKIPKKFSIDDDFLKDVKAYISKHFKMIEQSTNVWMDGVIIPNEVMNKYLDQFGDQLKKWWKSIDNEEEVVMVCKSENEPMEEGEINVCVPVLSSKPKALKDFSKLVLDALDFYINAYQLPVLCGGKKEQLEYFHNWEANAFQGNRNDQTCMVLSGNQGDGKSTHINFLTKHCLLHPDGYVFPSNRCYTTDFNGELAGKRFVFVEELGGDKFSNRKITENVKRYTTNDFISFKTEGLKPVSLRNFLNQYFLTNYTIGGHKEQGQGRRLFCFDVSDIYLNHPTFWDELRDRCFNDEVGQAYTAFLLERDVSQWKPRLYPESDTKTGSQVISFHPLVSYIREQYWMKKKGFKYSRRDFWMLFKTYCDDKDIVKYVSDDCYRQSTYFNFKLDKLGFNKDLKKSNGNLFLNYSWEEIDAIGKKHQWAKFTKYDDNVEEEVEPEFVDENSVESVENDETNDKIDKLTQSNQLLNDNNTILYAKNQELLKKIEEYEALMKKYDIQYVETKKITKKLNKTNCKRIERNIKKEHDINIDEGLVDVCCEFLSKEEL